MIDLNLFGKKSEEKFIPDLYKYNSVNSRIALLQGLMDTDGTVSSQHTYKGKKSNCAQFSTSSEKLKDDIEFLVNSLGGYITTYTLIPKYFNKKYKEIRFGKKHYTITIHLPDNSILFRLPRKKELVSVRKNKPRRKIKSIEYVGKLPGKCITVDSPNHLYLADKCIVTHNTLQIIYTALELKERKNIKHCLIICGVNTLKSNWKKEIQKHSNESVRILGERYRKSGELYFGSIKDRLDDLKSNLSEFF